VTAQLHPFDPKAPVSRWTPKALGLDPLPVFESAPVGNHRHLATCSLLYRFFDAERSPLYIGVTTAPTDRWRAHRQAEWWALARFVSLEAVPPRERLEYERRAIKTERPKFNRLRPGQPIRARLRLDYSAPLIIGQLREHMSADAFAALVAAFKAEPAAAPSTSTSKD